MKSNRHLQPMSTARRSNGETLLSVPNRYRRADSSSATRDSVQGETDQADRFSDIATLFGGQLIVLRNSASSEESAGSRLYEFYDLDDIRADAEPNRRVSININILCKAGNTRSGVCKNGMVN